MALMLEGFFIVVKSDSEVNVLSEPLRASV